MQADLGRRQEGLLPLDGSISAMGQHPFANASQPKESYLANRTSQKFELHAPLLIGATFLAVLLQVVPHRLQ